MDKKVAKRASSDVRVAFRLRQEDVDRLDEAVARMQKKAPWTKVTRADAVRAAIGEFSGQEAK